MKKLVIPLDDFVIPMKRQGKMRQVKMTLNNWIMIHGMNAGRIIANKRKHQIQAKIIPRVDQAIVDGLLSVFHGKAYQIMKVKTLSDREEW